jgi:UDP-N-acetylmuramoyl-tripeptide--D-alanyl-D-alanine ligase
MPRLTFAEIADMVGGEVLQGADVVAGSVVIDSREVKPDSVFFAITGERLNGHEFVPQALETAAGAVVSEVPHDVHAGKGIVRVADTTVALQALAQGIRERYPFTVIGITGSAGKTTTKEMIATLIATERRTFKSWGNFNNLIGAPLCLTNTPDDAEVVVSEMGMNHKGEIAQIAGWTRPHIGVYTNIGPVHIEFFGTVEKIAEAKRELLENLAPNGTVVYNTDNEHVVRITGGFEGPLVSYGIDDSTAHFRATDVQERGLFGTTFTLHAESSTRQLDLALPGRHNLYNLLAAIATARTVDISWDAIERGVREVKPAYHRGVIVQAPNGVTIYDDTYNSNPYALASALQLLEQAEVKGRRIAVIGDMLELGDEELRYHHDCGHAVPKSVAAVVAVGKRGHALLDGARESGFDDEQLHHFDTAEEAGEFLRGFVREGDLVLVKGSRGVGLDRTVAMLEREG